MLVSLLCQTQHHLIPDLGAGLTVMLCGDQFVMPSTPALRRRLADAIEARALVILGPGGGGVTDDVLADIEARHAALLRRIDAALAALARERHAERATRIAS